MRAERGRLPLPVRRLQHIAAACEQTIRTVLRVLVSTLCKTLWKLWITKGAAPLEQGAALPRYDVDLSSSII